MAERPYNNFTDELRTRLSIVDVVSRRVPLVRRGQNYWGCCPFHNEKTPSFSVSEEKGFYHCFGCGEHGDIISFTMKSENLEFRDAIRALADMAGIKMPDYKPKSAAQIAAEESYINITAHAAQMYQKKLYEPGGETALSYIRGRGFTDEMIKKYGIGYAPKNNLIANSFSNIKESALIATGLCRRGDYGMYDFFRHKLMFPIFNAHGAVVAFSGRSLDGSEPKYINTTDTEMFHKRQTIFGFNFARDAIHRNNRSIVVEGQIDAIQMQCNGFPETVAPLGTALTDDHIAILCKSNRNITFCFDGDNAGQKAASRAASIIMPFVRDTSDVRFAFVTGGKDPDEVLKTGGADAMHKIINTSIGLIDFLWQIANRKFVTSTPGGQSQAEKFLDKEVEKITDVKFRSAIKSDYDKRKFDEWRKWKKTKSVHVNIELPPVDDITKNTLIYIVNTYPEIIDGYGEFLATLNIDFDVPVPTMNLTRDSAERYIVSLKIQRYLQKLNIDKKEFTSRLLMGDTSVRDEINRIDTEIVRMTEKLERLINV
ncbi:MAG: DNA primase [Alphaproteobacteria bacterium]|nr:DNA primase [Alphaproteobacteria bacterium]